MAAGATYEPIATTIVTSGTSVTFSNIPQTYTDLVLTLTGTVDANCQIVFQVNSNTGTNYSLTYLYGDGTSAGGSRATTANMITYGALCGVVTSNSKYSATMNIQNYTNTSLYKSIYVQSMSLDQVETVANTFRSSSAITTIKILFDRAANFTNMTLTLHGIAAA